MIISRSEAIIMSSFLRMLSLDSKRLTSLTEAAMAEFERSDSKEEEKNEYLRKYIEIKFSNYTNTYLKIFIGRYLHFEFDIVGNEPKLEECPCCQFKTLKKLSEYFICPVCFWEDDGTSDNDKFSGANKMTLGEAKMNFSEFKAISERCLPYLDEDRFLQFVR